MEGTPHTVEKQRDYLLSSDIENRRETLEQELFLNVDMNLSQEEKESLVRINIEKALPQFDFYGTEGVELKKKVEEYLGDMGDNSPEDLSHIADIVSRLSEGMRKGFDTETTWTMIRVSLPYNEFEIPRWHSDGKYFNSTQKRYKLVATLKGPQTLFGETVDIEAHNRLGKELNDNYLRIEDDPEGFNEEDMRIRTELQKVVAQKEIGGQGEAIVYLVGEEDAVLHSEPNITEPRIFVSVLPGSDEQIAQWEGRTRS